MYKPCSQYCGRSFGRLVTLVMLLAITALGLLLVAVTGDNFTMGDTAGGRFDDEKPLHQVTVRGFYQGATDPAFPE